MSEVSLSVGDGVGAPVMRWDIGGGLSALPFLMLLLLLLNEAELESARAAHTPLTVNRHAGGLY